MNCSRFVDFVFVCGRGFDRREAPVGLGLGPVFFARRTSPEDQDEQEPQRWVTQVGSYELTCGKGVQEREWQVVQETRDVSYYIENINDVVMLKWIVVIAGSVCDLFFAHNVNYFHLNCLLNRLFGIRQVYYMLCWLLINSVNAEVFWSSLIMNHWIYYIVWKVWIYCDVDGW